MKKYWWVIIFLLSLLPLGALLFPGLPLTHDGPDHVARIANFYESLSEGNLVPRWAGNLNWGYGHPILMFLYPLPSYIASVFHAVGFNFVDSTKLVFGVALVLSALGMYFWASAEWGQLAGLFAAILYTFAPYRFVDLYVRGAIGEHLAFVFPPLAFWSLLRLSRDSKNSLWSTVCIALSTAGLILAHNALSLMFLPIIILYGLYLYFFKTKRSLKFGVYGLLAIGYGFLLSAFFWIPALIEGKYTLRDVVTKGDFTGRFTPWSWFVYSPWNYGGGEQFTKQLGIASWITILAAVWYFFKTKIKANRWFIGGSLLIIVLSLFLMTSWSTIIWNKVSLLQKFQFPWRLLSVTTLVTAILGGKVVSLIKPKYWVSIALLILTAVVLTVYEWRPVSNVLKPEIYFSGIYNSTTDTGENSPIWSVRFMEKRASAALLIAAGQATWTPVVRNSTKHIYTIKADTRTRIVENTLYFPGWKVLVDKQAVPVEFQDPNYRGLMTFWVGPGEHQIIIQFGETKLRSFSDAVSVISWLVLLGVVTLAITKNKMHH